MVRASYSPPRGPSMTITSLPTPAPRSRWRTAAVDRHLEQPHRVEQGQRRPLHRVGVGPANRPDCPAPRRKRRAARHVRPPPLHGLGGDVADEVAEAVDVDDLPDDAPVPARAASGRSSVLYVLGCGPSLAMSKPLRICPASGAKTSRPWKVIETGLAPEGRRGSRTTTRVSIAHRSATKVITPLSGNRNICPVEPPGQDAAVGAHVGSTTTTCSVPGEITGPPGPAPTPRP